MNNKKIDVNKMIEYIRGQGRHGDTMLAHISPAEATGLKMAGGAGTKNPKTGLPEFFGWDTFTDFISPVTEPLGEAMRFIGEPVGWVGDAIQGITGPNKLTETLKSPTTKKLAGSIATGYAAAPYFAPAVSAPGDITAAETIGWNGTNAMSPELVAENAAYATGAEPLAAAGGADIPAGFNMAGGPTDYAQAPFTPAQLNNFNPSSMIPSAEARMAGSVASNAIPPGAEAPPYEAGPWSPTNTDGGANTGIWDYIKGNPIKSTLGALAGANLLSSLTSASMAKDANTAQQESYDKYLNTLNPPDTVKDVRFGALAENARAQGVIAQKRIDDSLAARGIRGRGIAAPTGDTTEAIRKSINDAYNQIFGTYNVPGSPGPANYSPSPGQLFAGNAGQMAAQGIPLALLLSKYGVR